MTERKPPGDELGDMDRSADLRNACRAGAGGHRRAPTSRCGVGGDRRPRRMTLAPLGAWWHGSRRVEAVRESGNDSTSGERRDPTSRIGP
jgi:hypothetical protein